MTPNRSENTASLLVSCPDQRGIVAALAAFLQGHDGNILDADQHSDTDSGQFFQRIFFEMPGLSDHKKKLELAIKELAVTFDMTWKLSLSSDVKRMAILVSKYDHCLFDLMLRHRAGELNGDIAFVASNHSDLHQVAEQFGIPFFHLPIQENNKPKQEKELLALLEQHQIDVVVLARYMQVLSPALIDRYLHRVINIHHSFLPAFSGGRPYHQAHDRGVKLIGATAHYATSELDAGPIIAQDVVQCSHRDSVEDLTRKGRDVERAALAQALRYHLEDRILVYQNRALVLG